MTSTPMKWIVKLAPVLASFALVGACSDASEDPMSVDSQDEALHRRRRRDAGAEAATPPTTTTPDAGATADAAGPAPTPTPTPSPSPTLSVPTSVRWHIDIENPVDETVNADWFDIDLWDNLSSGLIGRLKARGRKVACYFSAGSGENWRPDYASIPAEAKGNGLSGWAGEVWLDIRHPGVRAVMAARLDRARAAGCDGVDPDNVDGYTNSSGFPLTAADQLDFNRFLAKAAHDRGMVVGLKNDLDQVSALVGDFDFAVNEQCLQYQECGALAPFAAANKSVLHIEYRGTLSTICQQGAQRGFFSILSSTLNLNGSYSSCP